MPNPFKNAASEEQENPFGVRASDFAQGGRPSYINPQSMVNDRIKTLMQSFQSGKLSIDDIVSIGRNHPNPWVRKQTAQEAASIRDPNVLALFIASAIAAGSSMGPRYEGF